MKTRITFILLLMMFCINTITSAQTLADANALLASASKKFRALPKTFSIPVPPVIEVKCGEVNKQQSVEIKRYEDKFIEPENSILKEIHSAGKIYSNLKNQTGEQAALDSACIVAGRLERKAIYALNGYGGDKNYFVPVASVAIKIAKDKTALNCGSNEVAELVAKKAIIISDLLLKELKNQHDFSLYRTIIYYHKIAANAGIQPSEDVLYDIARALNFEVKIEQELQRIESGKVWAIYKASGEARIAYDMSFLSGTILGNGKMKLSECWQKDMCNQPVGGSYEPKECTSHCEPETYSTGPTEIRIDACGNHDFTLLCSPFGPDMEQWTKCYNEQDGGNCFDKKLGKQGNMENTRMAWFTNVVLQEAGISPLAADAFKKDGGYSKFIIPLQNNNAELGKVEVIQLSQDKLWLLKLKITVTHAPL